MTKEMQEYAKDIMGLTFQILLEYFKHKTLHLTRVITIIQL